MDEKYDEVDCPGSSYFLTARSSQVTATPGATFTLPAPTETSIPTPTFHPQFNALQEQTASSGERFSLNGADGLIYDGAEPVAGLQVTPDDTITLTVNGETVMLDSATVNFDDESSVDIEGYELAEDGAWVEAKWMKRG